MIKLQKERSAGGRRTVVEPALKGNIRGRKNRLDGIDNSPGRFKQCESGRRSCPSVAVSQEVLPLSIRRMSLYRPYVRRFRTGYAKPGGQTYGQAANG